MKKSGEMHVKSVVEFAAVCPYQLLRLINTPGDGGYIPFRGNQVNVHCNSM